MLSSKSKVDKHVSALLQKQRTDIERKRVGYQVAEMYFKINEFQTASRYLDSFLEVNQDFYRAFNLRGKIFEELNRSDRALECYKRSLELNGEQKSVLVKVCELHLRMDVDPDRTRYWYERLEKAAPKHELLMRLKEKICSTGDTEENQKELEDLYTSELRKRPHDVKALVKLFELLVKQGRVNEAYTQATLEEATGSHDTNIEWYRCLLDIYEDYRQESGKELNGVYHQHLLWAQNQLLLLSIEQAKVVDATEVLKSFDETLNHAKKLACSTAKWSVFLQEMQAQLYFMSALLLLKKAKERRSDWKEASTLASACFLFSYSTQEPNLKGGWSAQANDTEQKLYERWYNMACYRLSQSGHMLRVLSRDVDEDYINIIQEEMCTEEGKQTLFQKLFDHHLVHACQDKSFLYSNTKFMTFTPRKPTLEDIQKLDPVFDALRPANLSHLLWRVLQYRTHRENYQPDYNFHLFDKLPYGNTKLSAAQTTTLSRLDIEVFVYAATLDASNRRRATLPEPGIPHMLPVAICEPLATPEQKRWWTAVYQLTHNINKEQQSESQRTLQFGLERLRLIGQHGLDSETLIQLARTFAQRLTESRCRDDRTAAMSDIVEEQNALQARVELYWDGAVKLLAKLKSKKNVTLPKTLLFTNRDTFLTDEDIDKLQEESRYNLGVVAMETEDYERAITEFSLVSWPEATYEKGQCYKKLADSTANCSLEGMDSDQRSQQRALLHKAKECFQDVLDQLASEQRNECYVKALDECEKLMDLLERFDFIDPAEVSRYTESVAPEETLGLTPVKSGLRVPQFARLSGSFSVSTPRGKSFLADPSSSAPNSTKFGSPRGTPRRPTQVSPERIDLQLQSYNRRQQELLDEVKKNRKHAQKLEDRVDDLETSVPKASDFKHLLEQNDGLLRAVKDLKEELRVRDSRLATVQADLSSQQDSTRKQMETLAELSIETKSLKMFLDNQIKAQSKVESQLRAELKAQHEFHIKELKAQDEAHRKRIAETEARFMADLQASVSALTQAQMVMQQQQMPAAHMMPPIGAPGPQVRPTRTGVPGYPGGIPAAYRLAEYEYPAYGVAPGYVGQQFPPMGGGAQYGQQPPSHGPQRTVKQPHGEDLHDNEEDFDEEENGFYPGEGLTPADDTQLPGSQGAGNDRHFAQVPGGDPQVVQQWPGANMDGRAQPQVGYSPQRPMVAQQPQFLGMSPTHGHMIPAYSPSGPPMPGPGFFSTQDPARSALPQPGFMGNAKQPLRTSVQAVTPQGVSAEDVSGINLIQLPQATSAGSTPVATSFPLTMPPNATPPSGNKYGGGTALDSTTPKSTATHRSPRKVSEAESEGEYAGDDSYNGPDFKPLVSLPEVETKTGEEHETALFNKRAKLFRFFEGQWKERGVGDIKILKDNQSNVRVLMRRDQVLKVCANHRIKADMEISYKAGDESKKVLTWSALDHTDESEVRMEQFCCRFKTPDIAAEFKQAFEKAKKIAASHPSPAKQKAAPTPEPKKDLVPTSSQSLPTQTAVVTPKLTNILADNKPTSGGFNFGSGAATVVMPSSQTSASDMLKAIAVKAGGDNQNDNGDKANVGGFTFSGSPVIKQVVEKPADEKPKPSGKQPEAKPFAGFSFGKPAFGAATFVTPKPVEFKPTSTAQSSGMAPTFGAISNTSAVTFGSLAKSGDGSDEKSDTVKPFDGTGNTGFSGAGKPVFGGKSPAKTGEDDDNVEEFEPDVDFKPIVTLPEKVDLKTGEEDEQKLFGHRGKLYRNDPETKQWKERGTGEIKIMKNIKTGTFRILMRREQVHKTCANHHLTKDMKLMPLQTSENAWCWFAQDFSEEELKAEHFAIRFKHKDQAERFKEVFEECLEKIGEEKPKPAEAKSVKSAEQEVKPVSLADQFKTKAGEWDCEACYVRNKAGTKRCAACETSKPGEVDDVKPAPSTVPGGGGSIQFGAPGGFTFGSAGGNAPPSFGKVSDVTVSSSQPTTGGFQFVGGFKTEPQSGGFKFGGLSGANLPEASKSTAGFGSISFGTPVKKEDKDSGKVADSKDSPAKPDSTTGGKPTGFNFGDASSGFSFSGVTPQKSDKPSAPKTPTSPGDEGDYYENQEGEDDHIYFAPIVKLPDNVELKTGEEDEDLLYCHRAKLFRFTDGEWKERGIGNIKIMRNKTSQKPRILMRREHVLKICLNHSLTKDLTLNPMANSKGKAWVWHALDFSEDEQAHEQFAIRFATEDIATDFKTHVDTARDIPSSLPAIEYVEDKAAEKKSRRRSDSYRSKSESKDSDKEGKDESKSSFNTFSFKSPEVGKPSASAIPKPVNPGFNFGAVPNFGADKPAVFGDLNKAAGFGTTQTSVFGGATDDTKSKSDASGGLLARLLSEPAKDEPLNLSSDAADSTSNDIIILRKEPVPDDKIQQARKWKLPDAFYLYDSRPPCKGCLGCNSDEFDFATIGSKAKVKVPEKDKKDTAKDLPSVKKTEPVVSRAEADPTSSIFGKAGSCFGDFGSLASSTTGKGFAFGNTSDKPFEFAGAGASVFNGKSPDKKSKDPSKSAEDDDADDDEVSESPDVHFEPIVHLPENVDLTTGEEGHDKVFSHRAKLYRYDNGQWKERAVGDMKILRDTQTGRYRLIMRREQVLKVACNHYLTADMCLQPLHTSETAWCWYAVDHAENTAKEEQFAVRFKTKDLATAFKEKFDECKQAVISSSSIDPSEASEKLGDVVQTQEETGAENPVTSTTDADPDDEGSVSSDDVRILFSKRATLSTREADGSYRRRGMGELTVTYDEDVFGARIQMVDDNEEFLCNHIICRRHILNVGQNGKSCEWTAKDFSTDEPIRHTFQAEFSSKNAVDDFKEVFDQGLEWATESEIDEVVDGASVTGEMMEPQIADSRK